MRRLNLDRGSGLISHARITRVYESDSNSANKGEDVVVPGVSHIRWKGDKAVYHRDYFDLGAMVYEQVPVLSTVVRAIRKKMATR